MDLEGVSYFGSYDNKIYAVNPDGTLRWKYETEWVISSSPAISPDGIVYIGGWDGFLYAIGKRVSRVTCSISRNRIKSGESISIYGELYPKLQSYVTIWISKNGEQYKPISEIAVTNGSYMSKWSTLEPGIYRMKVSWKGVEDYEDAVSEEVYLEVSPVEELVPAIIILCLAALIFAIFARMRRASQKTS
ncbi:MAG: hypothetical protein ACUVQ0_04805 [Thermoproteota archaeon]